MRNVMEALQDITETLWNHCGALWSITSITEPLRDVTERYGTLWNVVECYKTLWKSYRALHSVMEHYRSDAGALQDVCGVTEHYETLRDVNEALQKCCGSLRNQYGAVTECYGTIMENINFAHH